MTFDFHIDRPMTIEGGPQGTIDTSTRLIGALFPDPEVGMQTYVDNLDLRRISKPQDELMGDGQ